MNTLFISLACLLIYLMGRTIVGAKLMNAVVIAGLALYVLFVI